MNDILKPVRECVRGHKERRAPTAIESQLAKRVVELERALTEALEFAEGYEDVRDGSDGPLPNDAMHLCNNLRALLGK